MGAVKNDHPARGGEGGLVHKAAHLRAWPTKISPRWPWPRTSMHSLLRPASTASAASPPSGKRKSAARQRRQSPRRSPPRRTKAHYWKPPCLQGGLNAFFKGFVAPDALQHHSFSKRSTLVTKMVAPPTVTCSG